VSALRAEILVGYLESLRQRGFLSMMLWGCPPLPGDDYVIYCHPPDQKIPKPDRFVGACSSDVPSRWSLLGAKSAPFIACLLMCVCPAVACIHQVEAVVPADV
jgi:hypothetical protein